MEFDTNTIIEKAQYAINRAKASGAEGTFVNADMSKAYSTRFANSAIHQNFVDDTVNLTITVIKGQKNSSVTLNTFDEKEIARMVDYATNVVGLLPDDPDFPGILREPQNYQKLTINDPAIKNLTANDVADKIISGINAGHEYSKKVKTVSGNLNFRDGVSIFLSSEGLENITPQTSMTSTINIMAEDMSGESRSNSDFGHRIFKELPFETEAAAVADRSVKGLNAQMIEAKAYPAILDFQAAATPSIFTGMALSAKMILDHSSYLMDRMGEQVFSKNMSVINDPHDPKFLSASPMDNEGIASQKYTLINNGVIENYAHNRLTANKMGTQSNGCGFTFFGRPMSFPIAMKISPGTKSRDTLLSEIDDGLLITNFHYTNFVDPTRGILTGMTKDGLFIIKNGEIVGSAKNMRFTDGIVNMLSNAEMSKEVYQAIPFGMGMQVPAMKIDSINFSSDTTH
ncbi:MAG: TldD/PmbA family protein [Candidatus Kariarchaeaceae archaeon]